MPTVPLVYVGPYDEIEIIATGQTCRRGDTVEVDSDIAGNAPKGDEPGDGLLAQASNWAKAGTKAAKDIAAPTNSEKDGD